MNRDLLFECPSFVRFLGLMDNCSLDHLKFHFHSPQKSCMSIDCAVHLVTIVSGVTAKAQWINFYGQTLRRINKWISTEWIVDSACLDTDMLTGWWKTERIRDWSGSLSIQRDYSFQPRLLNIDNETRRLEDSVFYPLQFKTLDIFREVQQVMCRQLCPMMNHRLLDDLIKIVMSYCTIANIYDLYFRSIELDIYTELQALVQLPVK